MKVRFWVVRASHFFSIIGIGLETSGTSFPSLLLPLELKKHQSMYLFQFPRVQKKSRNIPKNTLRGLS